MAGQVLWTTYFPQIHWAGHSGSLCAVYSDQATDKSLSWPGLSSLQAQNLSYQESLVRKGEKYVLFNHGKKEQLQKLKGKLMQCSKNAEYLIIFLLYFVDTHPQKDGLDFATVLSFLLLCTGIKDIFGRNTCIRNALPVTYHPYENIRNAVLRLQLRKKARIKHDQSDTSTTNSIICKW